MKEQKRFASIDLAYFCVTIEGDQIIFTATPLTWVKMGGEIATKHYFYPNMTWGLATGGAFVKHGPLFRAMAISFVSVAIGLIIVFMVTIKRREPLREVTS